MTPGFKQANPPTYLRARCQVSESLAPVPCSPSWTLIPRPLFFSLPLWARLAWFPGRVTCFLSSPMAQGRNRYPALTLKALRAPSLVWPVPVYLLASPGAGEAPSVFLPRGRWGEEEGWDERVNRKRTQRVWSHAHLYLFSITFPIGRKDEGAKHMAYASQCTRL